MKNRYQFQPEEIKRVTLEEARKNKAKRQKELEAFVKWQASKNGTGNESE